MFYRRERRKRRVLAAVCALLVLPVPVFAEGPFAIRVVDDETGRGVPLVELRTTNQLRFVTDSSGWAVIDEPALDGRQVFFHVTSHGYEFPADGFGYRGRRLQVESGNTCDARNQSAEYCRTLVSHHW